MLITDLVQEVLYETPHAPEPLVEKMLIESAKMFCQRTRRWVVAGDDISIVADTKTYALTAPAQTDSDSNPLTFRIISVEGFLDENEEPFTRFTYNDESITLDYTPTDAITLTAEYQLKPLLSSTAIYDPLYEDYSEGIISGAKYRLMRMKNVAWEDQQGAMRNNKIFDAQIHRCRTNKWNEDGSKELTRRLTGW